MTRLLALAILILLVYLVLSAALERLKPPPPQRRSGGTGKTAGGGPTEKLVRCPACGVRVPESRTVRGTQGERYCSEECRRHGPARPG